MPNVTITIGGRGFQVACKEGEEDYLHTAAAMLDTEASSMVAGGGRMPESQLLLMSGLLLADKTAGLEDRVKTLEAELEQARSGGDSGAKDGAAKEAITSMTNMVERVEALAKTVEAKS